MLKAEVFAHRETVRLEGLKSAVPDEIRKYQSINLENMYKAAPSIFLLVNTDQSKNWDQLVTCVSNI